MLRIKKLLICIIRMYTHLTRVCNFINIFKLPNRSRWVYTRNIIKGEGYIRIFVSLINYET